MNDQSLNIGGASTGQKDDDGRVSYSSHMRLGLISMFLLVLGVFGWAWVVHMACLA